MTTLHREVTLATDPPGKALAQIGEPAIPAVEKVLDSEDRTLRFRATYVLLNIGTPEAKSILRSHIDKEKDEGLKDYIQRVTNQ